jgi:hypothetical protein
MTTTTPGESSPGPPDDAAGTTLSHRSHTGYAAGLWIIAPLMPGVAAIVTIVAYLYLPKQDGVSPAAPQEGWPAVVIGIVATTAVWLIGALLARGLVTASRAQVRAFGELLERLRTLENRAAGITATSADEKAALSEATTHLAHAAIELRGEGKDAALRWALASGYMSVMRGLHRAEEALIMAESTDEVVGDAVHDVLSLEGSAIGNRDRLINILRICVRDLSPAAAEAFLDLGSPGKNAPSADLTPRQSREALREVRFAVNEFRDDRNDGLIRARNRLVWTMLAVGITTYLLLGLALFANVSIPYVQSVAVFYLVGAIVGLFNRLRIEAGKTSAVEDYGLSQARLVVTPLVSGLAAVAGVYLIAVTPALFTTGTDASTQPPALSAVFDLAANPLGLLYAAIFGLAPSTLTNRLALASTKLEQDLQSTEAASTTGSNEEDKG